MRSQKDNGEACTRNLLVLLFMDVFPLFKVAHALSVRHVQHKEGI